MVGLMPLLSPKCSAACIAFFLNAFLRSREGEEDQSPNLVSKGTYFGGLILVSKQASKAKYQHWKTFST